VFLTMLSLSYLEVGHKRKNHPSVTPQSRVKPPLSGTIQSPYLFSGNPDPTFGSR